MSAIASGNDDVGAMIVPKKSAFSRFRLMFEPFQASKKSAEPLN
jgi:hypothetical protein